MSEAVNIFIIDDDKYVLKILSSQFKHYDVEVHTFQDPTIALSQMEEMKPQIVFLDYHMPDLNGQDVIIKVSEAKLFSHSSIYLVTGSDFCGDELIKLKTLGFYDVFPKPLTRETIESVLQEHLGKVPYKAA